MKIISILLLHALISPTFATNRSINDTSPPPHASKNNKDLSSQNQNRLSHSEAALKMHANLELKAKARQKNAATAAIAAAGAHAPAPAVHPPDSSLFPTQLPPGARRVPGLAKPITPPADKQDQLIAAPDQPIAAQAGPAD